MQSRVLVKRSVEGSKRLVEGSKRLLLKDELDSKGSRRRLRSKGLGSDVSPPRPPSNSKMEKL
tara:strand:+ start:4161 stop:4349 length:189 start_codon:yes stop_codon:yes gene_type:complete